MGRMRRILVTPVLLSLSLLLLLAVHSQAQEERWEFPAVSQGDIRFVVDAAGFRGPPGKTHKEIYYLLTTEGLRLARGEGGYRGSIEVTVLLRTSEGEEAARRQVQRTVAVDSLSYRAGRPTAVLDLVPVQLPAGDYELAVTIRDLNGEGEGICRGMLEIPAFDSGELSISDLQFASEIQVGVSSGKFVKNGRKVTPNPLRRFGPGRTSFPVYFEVYRLASPDLEEGNEIRSSCGTRS